MINDPTDAAEVVTIHQIGIAIFAQGEHKLGRCSSRHINNGGADAA